MAKLRILHIDDDEFIREIAHFLLVRDPDFDVRSCSSGRLGLVEAARWRPDIILLDVVMPDLDGPRTLQLLKQNADTADIPIAFVTARAEQDDVEDYLAIGAVGVIQKPFVPTTLAWQIRTIVDPAVQDR